MFYSRVSSGLDFLDAAIGGLYSNRCYVMRGPGQSGRTTASLQFLMGGLENGEKGVMISSDRIENVILKAEAMGITIEPYLLDNRLILMEYPQDILAGRFHYGGIVNLLGEIEQYIQSYGCSRLAVDTLLPLLIKPRETHFVSYIYSLVNSFDQMQVTTMLTIGEPNSPTALRITQLIEDAAVGSFVLSKLDTRVGEQRVFSIHKMINAINPPQSFKIKMEYGVGLMQDIQKQATPHALPPASSPSRTISDIPLHITLLDSDEDALAQVEEIFHQDSQIASYESEEEFALQIYNLDCDLLLMNANQSSINWRQIISLLRDAYPKLPIFLILDNKNQRLTYQAAKQSGADGLFYKPLVPADVKGAFEKALRGYGTYGELFEKRGSVMPLHQIPEDLSDMSSGIPGVDGSIGHDANLIGLSEFKERLVMQIWRNNQERTSFSLISFKTVYIGSPNVQTNVPQGLELMKNVASFITSSLRGLNDVACRHMDKIVVMLEDSEKEGAKAFAKRVVGDLAQDLSTRLNIQFNKHFHILTAVATFPEDGDNVNELMSQVTDVARNFIKSLN